MTSPHGDDTRDGARSEEARLHADALCRCIWCDRPDEADYHRAVLDRLEHGQPADEP